MGEKRGPNRICHSRASKYHVTPLAAWNILTVGCIHQKQNLLNNSSYFHKHIFIEMCYLVGEKNNKMTAQNLSKLALLQNV